MWESLQGDAGKRCRSSVLNTVLHDMCLSNSNDMRAAEKLSRGEDFEERRFRDDKKSS